MDANELMGPRLMALTERRRRFVLAMAAEPFAPAREWALAAGYSDVKEGAKVRASENLTDPKVRAAVREVAEATLGAEGPIKAVQTLMDIVSERDNPNRIKAAEAILNRVGMGEKQQIEVVHRDLTGDALMERIAALAAKHGVDLGRLGVSETRSVSREAEPKVIEHQKDEGL